VNIRFWGTRGSVPAAGRGTQRYGGNTSCVELRAVDGALTVLDAGTGICMLGATLPFDIERVDVLLSHLHMDHILGLGFFTGLFRPDLVVHLWGPGSTTQPLRARLTRYLSPPLFPVSLRDLPCRLELHDVPLGTFEIPGLVVTTALVCHPGPTVGYRIEAKEGVVTYLSDHEPALGLRNGRWPGKEWISGYDLAVDADLLIHDAQYTDEQYKHCLGWGHSTYRHALEFAAQVGAREMVPFHHDPSHDDATLDRLLEDALRQCRPGLKLSQGREGAVFQVGAR